MRKPTLASPAIAAGAASPSPRVAGSRPPPAADDGGDYPSGTVEMYVGADAGGSSDLISRAVSKGLCRRARPSFPVDQQARAPTARWPRPRSPAPSRTAPTIAIQNASLFAITPLAVAEDEVTNIDDFDVVQGVSRDDYVMVDQPGQRLTPASRTSRPRPKKVTYGTTGVGTGSQLSCALLLAAPASKARPCRSTAALRR